MKPSSLLLCSLQWAAIGSDECSGRKNIFMAWPEDPEHLLSDHLATLESVFYNYPSGNVVLVGSSLASSRVGQGLLSVRAKGYCLSFRDIGEFKLHADGLNAFLTAQFFVYSLQSEFGGLYVPFDGGLVNTLEYVLPAEYSGSSVFQEIVGHSSPDALQREDYENMIWERSWMDRHEGSSVLCSVHCLRFVAKGDHVGSLILDNFRASGTHPDLILTRHVKGAIRSVIVLPYWLIAENRFPDHWYAFGSSPGFVNPSTDLHSPREHRYKQDYWMVVSHKLWVPWLSGSGEELNNMDLSVTTLVRQQFSLELFSPPFTPLFEQSQPVNDLGIKTPLDQIDRLMTKEQKIMRKFFDVREAGLPGDRGGYRTFRHLKVLSAKFNFVRLLLTSPVSFSCRVGEPLCEGSLVNGQVKICDNLANINSALSGLKYGALSELNAFFKINVTVEGVVSCPNSDIGSSDFVETSFAALNVDPVTSVTVIAHSAERCFLLKRMLDSLHRIYPGMKAVVTCECDPSADTCLEQPVLVSNKYPLTEWFSVPYDYGLSRGKEFAISRVSTKFILVLDDDFVLSFNSCVECLAWRMESGRHSADWHPLDIVGIPVLEDERSFGAFRGTLRVAESKFFVEPFYHQSSPDGCARVDICPMVFLARTERLKLLKWNHALPVGEHEQFFYANQYHGIQVAVCADSTFVHLRLNTTMNEGYVARRGRMRELMSSAFSDVGIGQTYYFFHKYSHVEYQDFEQLASKGINPYVVPNDGGPRDITFGRMQLAVVGILTGTDEFSRGIRSWYREKIGYLGLEGTIQYSFLVSASGRSDMTLRREVEQFNDIVWIPTAVDTQPKYILEFFRRFLFYYFVMVNSRESRYDLHSDLFHLSGISNREMIFGSVSNKTFLSRDLYSVLSDPINLKRLRVTEGGHPLQSIVSWAENYSVRSIDF